MVFEQEIYRKTWKNLTQSKAIAPVNQNKKVLPVPLQIFETIPSTNQKLWELIDRQATTPLGAIALEQTAGRGQWGRQWQSNRGGLYLSLGIVPNLALDDYFHLVMATAWGIATVLRDYQLPVLLKWSNDLILERRKLGGIKIETRTTQQQITHAVIGVGINYTNPVPEMGINLQSYYRQSTARAITSLEELAAITAYGILWGYEFYLAFGSETLLSNYLAILTSLGQTVTINNCTGIVTGVTANGKLKVKLRSPGATAEIHLSPGQISLGYQF